MRKLRQRIITHSWKLQRSNSWLGSPTSFDGMKALNIWQLCCMVSSNNTIPWWKPTMILFAERRKCILFVTFIVPYHHILGHVIAFGREIMRFTFLWSFLTQNYKFYCFLLAYVYCCSSIIAVLYFLHWIFMLMHWTSWLIGIVLNCCFWIYFWKLITPVKLISRKLSYSSLCFIWIHACSFKTEVTLTSWDEDTHIIIIYMLSYKRIWITCWITFAIRTKALSYKIDFYSFSGFQWQCP